MKRNLIFRTKNSNCSGYIEYDNMTMNPNDEIFQYIGVCDMNGEKIFEGQNISFQLLCGSSNYCGNNEMIGEYTGIVLYSPYQAAFVIKNTTPKRKGKYNPDMILFGSWRLQRDSIKILPNTKTS